MGIEEIVGAVEIVGLPEGALEVVGAVEMVGAVVIVGDADGRSVSVGLPVGEIVGSNAGIH